MTEDPYRTVAARVHGVPGQAPVFTVPAAALEEENV